MEWKHDEPSNLASSTRQIEDGDGIVSSSEDRPVFSLRSTKET